MRFGTRLAVAFFLSAGGAAAQQETPEAPFGDRVSERIPFYHRAAPTIAAEFRPSSRCRRAEHRVCSGGCRLFANALG
jgi:hypothetical protein